MNASIQGTPRHFIDIGLLDPQTLRDVMDLGKDLKSRRVDVRRARPLDGKALAMVFNEPSTRTRMSFDLAMRELGGDTIVITIDGIGALSNPVRDA